MSVRFGWNVTFIGAVCTVLLPAALNWLALLRSMFLASPRSVVPAEGFSRLSDFPVPTVVLYRSRLRVH